MGDKKKCILANFSKKPRIMIEVDEAARMFFKSSADQENYKKQLLPVKYIAVDLALYEDWVDNG